MSEDTTVLDRLTADLFDLDIQAVPVLDVGVSNSSTDNTSTDCGVHNTSGNCRRARPQLK
jgi:hypothetical protein